MFAIQYHSTTTNYAFVNDTTRSDLWVPKAKWCIIAEPLNQTRVHQIACTKATYTIIYWWKGKL